MSKGFRPDTISEIGYVEKLRDFDWSTKLAADCDTSLKNLQPLVQLNLHFFADNTTKQFEFTPEELSRFLSELKEVPSNSSS